MTRRSGKVLFALVCTLSLGMSAGTSEAKRRHSSNKVVKKVVRSELVHTQVKQEIARTIPAGLALVSLSLPSSLERRASSRDTISLHWRKRPSAGRAVVQVLVHKPNGRTKTGWARVELAPLGRVLVAAMNLPAGTILARRHFRVEERVLETGKELSVEPEYVIGSKVVYAIAASVTLKSSAVVMPMPVSRGTPVRVEVRRGGVVVSAAGVLETTTKVGMPTRVRVSGRMMSGRLVSEGTVVVAPLALAGGAR